MAGNEHERRRVTRTLLGGGVAIALAASLVACSSEEERIPSVGYAIDNTVSSYNANTVDGAASGAAQALVRVLPGFGYVGPSGHVVSDTDIGIAEPVPGEVLTVRYRLSENSVYSDGVPMSCDDLVLTWAAASGRFTEPDESGEQRNLFDASHRTGYADIERVDCLPGSKEATVVFAPGRGGATWTSLFGATELMPSHIVARAANVPDLVPALTNDDRDAVRRIAEFWNTGWSLLPGEIDTSLLPASGPYRIESYTEQDGLVLVANERWWGNAPATDRIVVWPRGTDTSTAASEGHIHVLDTGQGALRHTMEFGSEIESTTVVSRNLEQFVLSTGGVFESAAARRAFALCVPRDALFDELGDATGSGSTGPVGSRLIAPDSPLYPLVTGPAERYAAADVDAARGEREAAGLERMEVRVGYLATDGRRARMIELVADSCRDAGIDVVDAGSESFVPSALGNEVDAILAGTASGAGAGGTESMIDARTALHSAAGSNVGGYSNGRIDEILGELAATGDSATIAGLAGEAEGILWDEMPTVPLLLQPRTTGFAAGMQATQANPTTAGAGWNMDRWILTG